MDSFFFGPKVSGFSGREYRRSLAMQMRQISLARRIFNGFYPAREAICENARKILSRAANPAFNGRYKKGGALCRRLVKGAVHKENGPRNFWTIARIQMFFFKERSADP